MDQTLTYEFLQCVRLLGLLRALRSQAQARSAEGDPIGQLTGDDWLQRGERYISDEVPIRDPTLHDSSESCLTTCLLLRCPPSRR